MRNETSHYFRSAMDALGKFEIAATADAIDATLGSSLRSFGYDRYLFATPFHNGADTLARRRLLMDWPKAWREQYEHERFVEVDAIAAAFRHSCKSFRWSDLAIKEVSARRLMDVAARDHGMTFGFCVPLHGLRGYEAGLSAAGREVDDGDGANFAIELIAIYAFNRLSRLRSQPGKRLTPRQREILRWIAVGKTTWDVSAILGISEDTVKKTAASAMRRLNTHTRAQAVAEAIRLSEISL